jgi:hypothetical protein
VVLYGFKFTLPQKHVEYPDKIHYKGAGYQYEDTVRKSPTGFVRKKGVCDEGFIILVQRKDKKDKIPEEAYIYEGFFKYREYRLINE